MAKKSATVRIVRKTAADIPAASAADVDRLRSVMKGEIDTSEIPERQGSFSRLQRDASGRLPKRSLIRDAIVRELERNNMTPYRLWKEARAYCSTLSQPAVYEFIKGQRQLELPYAEALMAAVQLKVVRGAPRRKKTGKQDRRKTGAGAGSRDAGG
jgi:hypothetical protein